MENKPLVSVMIPVYNRIDIIDDTISSVLSQTYENIEIIIRDNCSSDGTFEYLLEKYGKDERFKIEQNSENLGPVGNWKTCLDSCNGKYTKILWSDDKISSNFISEFVDILENNQKIAFCISNIDLFSDSGLRHAVLFKKQQLISKNKYYKKLFVDRKMPVSPGCALFRTSDLFIDEQIENSFGINHYRTGAGIDSRFFLNTLLKKNYSFVCLSPACCSFFRDHKGSITVQNKLIRREYYVSDLDFIFKKKINKKYALKMFPGIIRFEKKYDKQSIKTIVKKYNAEFNYFDIIVIKWYYFFFLLKSFIRVICKRIKRIFKKEK